MLATVNGVEINYEVSGNEAGPWLTFSNSLATNLHMWDAQAEAFGADFHILRYDKRGHGGSPPVEGPYRFDDLVGDVVALWDHLGIDQSYFVGLSIGGMTAQGLMLDHPDRLKAVVIANSMGKIAPEFAAAWGERVEIARKDGMEPLVDGTMARWFTEACRAKNLPEVAAVENMVRTTSVPGYAGCIAAIQTLSFLDRLGEIRNMPVLFIAGAQDTGTPPAGMEAMHKAMPGSEYVLIDPAAHISNVERTETFNDACRTFLAQH